MSSSIPLDPAQASQIDRLVAEGRFSSTAEAVAAGVGLLLAREGRMSDLRTAWRDGVESGDYQPLDVALDELAERYATPEKAGA